MKENLFSYHQTNHISKKKIEKLIFKHPIVWKKHQSKWKQTSHWLSRDEWNNQLCTEWNNDQFDKKSTREKRLAGTTTMNNFFLRIESSKQVTTPVRYGRWSSQHKTCFPHVVPAKPNIYILKQLFSIKKTSFFLFQAIHWTCLIWK